MFCRGNKTPSQLAVEENLYDLKRIIDGVQGIYDYLERFHFQMLTLLSEVHNFLESLNLDQYKLVFFLYVFSIGPFISLNPLLSLFF